MLLRAFIFFISLNNAFSALDGELFTQQGFKNDGIEKARLLNLLHHQTFQETIWGRCGHTHTPFFEMVVAIFVLFS